MDIRTTARSFRQASEKILGCRFSVAVMSDGYIDQILSAIASVSTENIRAHTDALSTTYRGRPVHVFNALQAFFSAVNDGKTHVTLEALFTGDEAKSGEILIAREEFNLLPMPASFEVLCKFSFYPLGCVDYKDHISHAVRLVRERGISHALSSYATELRGDAGDLFAYFKELIDYAERHVDHFALHVTFSINSPTNTAHQRRT